MKTKDEIIDELVELVKSVSCDDWGGISCEDIEYGPFLINWFDKRNEVLSAVHHLKRE